MWSENRYFVSLQFDVLGIPGNILYFCFCFEELKDPRILRCNFGTFSNPIIFSFLVGTNSQPVSIRRKRMKLV